MWPGILYLDILLLCCYCSEKPTYKQWCICVGALALPRRKSNLLNNERPYNTTKI